MVERVLHRCNCQFSIVRARLVAFALSGPWEILGGRFSAFWGHVPQIAFAAISQPPVWRYSFPIEPYRLLRFRFSVSSLAVFSFINSFFFFSSFLKKGERPAGMAPNGNRHNGVDLGKMPPPSIYLGMTTHDNADECERAQAMEIGTIRACEPPLHRHAICAMIMPRAVGLGGTSP